MCVTHTPNSVEFRDPPPPYRTPEPYLIGETHRPVPDSETLCLRGPVPNSKTLAFEYHASHADNRGQDFRSGLRARVSSLSVKYVEVINPGFYSTGWSAQIF